ncbi:prolyl oligopeptidase family serine peptidase [Ruegeria pomeroyi]|nr:prolyl oligopeptidase family serine peptidase [Ruegeria pomeroyi]
MSAHVSHPARFHQRLAAGLAALFLCLGTPLLAEMFGPVSGQVHGVGPKVLVIVLHGDSGPDYITSFATELAARNPQATVIQMARPGYSVAGRRSKGSNNGSRDHYTKQNNNLLAQGISTAGQAYPHQKLVVVAHSGGAAQTATLLGTVPGLIDTAIMVSGPFDIPRWRAARGTPWPKSQSPIRYLDQIPRQTRIIAVTGQNDSNTQPGLARDYVAKAQARGLNATFTAIPNAGHSFRSLKEPVLAIATREIQS